MKLLVLGATGATGRLVVKQLINRNVDVKAVVRKDNRVLKELENNNLLKCVVGNISEFELSKVSDLINNCDAVISCLGHNITFKGIFGKPRMLVSDSIKNICKAIKESKKDKVKVILMNTTACRNEKLKENYSFGDRTVLFLLKLLLPPQKDNVEAAKYLSNIIGETNSKIEWVILRPDTLINEEKESAYEIFESPKRSPVFDAGKTSRINVGHFMSDLITSDSVWEKWKGKMPVIYNSALSLPKSY
jgi:nucleoside-diphosphate-sugar epimerase